MNTLRHLLLALGAFLFATIPSTLAAPGDLDMGFGSGGKVVNDFGADDVFERMAVQSDGKIVVATRKSLVRYTPTGALDATFGSGGKVDIAFLFIARDMTLQSDGMIVVAGSMDGQDFGLVRYTAAGELDTSFGSGGWVRTEIGSADEGRCVAVQSDGQIVVAGYSFNSNTGWDFALVRYTATGALDASFGNGGKVIADLRNGNDDYVDTMALGSDGAILVSVYSVTEDQVPYMLARYSATGALDTSFGSGGKVINDIGVKFAVRAMGNSWWAAMA